MNPPLNDEAVIRHYLGTRPADCFAILYNRYVRKVRAWCLFLVQDDAKAQDFAHDVFIKMFTHLAHFQERAAFATWLHAITYHYCMDQLRRANRLVTLPLNNDVEPTCLAGDDADPAEGSLRHLSHAMQRIAPQEVLILRLHYQNGLAIRQIAQQLHLKESTVKMRLKRSRDKVRRLCRESMRY